MPTGIHTARAGIAAQSASSGPTHTKTAPTGALFFTAWRRQALRGSQWLSERRNAQVMQLHQDSRKRGATGRQGRHNITNSNMSQCPAKTARITGNTGAGIGIFVSIVYSFTF